MKNINKKLYLVIVVCLLLLCFSLNVLATESSNVSTNISSLPESGETSSGDGEGAAGSGGAGEDGGGYNCNADDAACWVAEALKADKLIFLTDTDGILVDYKNETTRIPHMNRTRAHELMETGLVAGGMVPKVLSCIHAVEHGVGAVGILNGGVDHALLLETLAPNSLGTTITKD